jgi:hypothetical protein
MHPLDSVWQSCVREFDSACLKAARTSRTETTDELSQIVRRLKNSENESDLVDSALDGTARFAKQVAWFAVEEGKLRARGARRMNLPTHLAMPWTSAAAFANAIESRDTVVTMRAPLEVSEALSSGDNPERAFLIPILNRTRVAAVLFASADDETDLNGVELLSSISSAMLECLRRKGPIDQDGVVEAADSSSARPRPVLPSWSDLEETHRNLHIRAQRFARIKVAEIQLYKSELCQKGTERQDLYLYLTQEIDSARESFRTQFMTISTMVDYLHLELVGSLAHGDEFLLGADYPGQMQ